MGNGTPCPSPEDLHRFVNGQLSGEDFDGVARHVEECPVCVEHLRTIDRDSPLLDDMRCAYSLWDAGPGQKTNTLVEALYRKQFETIRSSVRERELVPAKVSMPIDDRYEMLNELGRGGMGVVFKARQRSTQRLVALKMIVSGEYARAEDRARFASEIELAARMRHANIVQVYEAGEFGDRPFYSMEFVEGETLAARLQSGPLAPLAAAAVIERLAKAVQFAHEHHVLHRDLKPANILLDRSAGGVVIDNEGLRVEPKIADFGLAKRLDAPGQTRTDAVLGTPRYMAPEQARGDTKSLGPAADIYSLGAILYELLTGRPPFLAASSIETIDAVLRDDPVPPRQLQPRMPRDLETICLKCLSKEPGRRYASAAELANRLRLVLDGKPIPDRPVGVLERAWRLSRRKPLAAALIAVTMVGLVAVTWFWRESETARQRAEASADDIWQRLYAADMSMVSDLAAVGDLPAMRKILDRYRDAGPRKDPREFTWHHFQHIVETPRGVELPVVAGGYTCAAFSPDGSRIALGTGEGKILVRDFTSELSKSPSKSWDAHQGPVTQIVWGADGEWISTGDDQMIRWWDGSGKLIRKYQPPSAKHIRLSTQGRLAAFHDRSLPAAPEHVIFRIVSLPGGEYQASFETRDFFKNIEFCPGDEYFVCWGGSLARRHSTRDRTAHDATEYLFGSLVHCISFSGNGSRFAIGLVDGAALLRETRAISLPPAMRFELGIPRLQGAIRAIALAHDDESLYTACDDLTIRRWYSAGRPNRLVGGTSERQIQLVVDPSDRRLVSIGESGKATLWDVAHLEDGNALLASMHPIGPIAFAGDHRMVAVACRDHTVRVIDAEADEKEQTVSRLDGHRARILQVAVTPNGRYVATASADLTWRWWDAHSGRLLKVVSEHEPLARLKISRDGRWLAVGRLNGAAELWRLDPSQNLPGSPARTIVHSDQLVSLALSGDGGTLWTFSNGGKLGQAVRTWETETGNEKGKAYANPFVSELSDVADGKLLVSTHDTARNNGEFFAWDLREDNPKRLDFDRDFGGATTMVHDLAVSPRGDIVAIAQGVSIYLFSLRDRNRCLGIVDTLPGEVRGLTFSPDGKRLGAVSGDHVLRIWNTNTWALIQPAGQPLGPVRDLMFFTPRSLLTGTATPGGHVERLYAPFGKNIAMTRHDNFVSDKLRIWDVKSDRESPDPILGPRHRGISCFALASDRHTLLAGSIGGKLLRFNIDRREPVEPYYTNPSTRAINETSELAAKAVAVSRDWIENLRDVAVEPKHGWIALLDDTGQVAILEERTGDLLHCLPKDPDNLRSAIAFTSDGKFLLVAVGQSLEMWPLSKTQSGIAIGPSHTRPTDHKRPIVCLAVSADGNLIATGSSDNSIGLWNRAIDIHQSLLGHTAEVTTVTFAPDGKTLASGGRDSTVRLWHALTGQPLATLRNHDGDVLCLAFSPDGRSLASAGRNSQGTGSVSLWKCRR